MSWKTYGYIRVAQRREIFPVAKNNVELRSESRFIEVRKSRSGVTWLESCRHQPTVQKQIQEKICMMSGTTQTQLDSIRLNKTHIYPTRLNSTGFLVRHVCTYATRNLRTTFILKRPPIDCCPDYNYLSADGYWGLSLLQVNKSSKQCVVKQK